MQKLKLDELGRDSVEVFKEKAKFPLVIVLDNIRSALNVGSAFRTADAFALRKIVCVGFTATPPHREILKTALGSTESVEWVHYEEVTIALQDLKAEGYTILSIEQTSDSVLLDNYALVADASYALVFGNEVDGVSDEALALSDAAIEIPQFGTKHSLNVSVCVGILSWDFVRRWSKSTFVALALGLFLAACGGGGDFSQGQALYKSQCANCHMEDGSGLQGLIPPLANADYLITNKDNIACIIHQGMEGSIVVNGVRYNQQVMPANPKLTDAEITNITNYILTAWGNQGGTVRLPDVKAQVDKCR